MIEQSNDSGRSVMMKEKYVEQRPRVIGPHGEVLTLEDLPPPNTKRWVIRRKAQVVAAVRGGLISLDEACRRYALSVEEFLSWQRAIEDHGLPGLRTTRVQIYRDTDERRRSNNAAGTNDTAGSA